MAKEEIAIRRIITKDATIEEAYLLREVADWPEPPKKEFYHWLERHIFHIGLVVLLLLGIVLVVGLVGQKTYHMLW